MPKLEHISENLAFGYGLWHSTFGGREDIFAVWAQPPSLNGK